MFTILTADAFAVRQPRLSDLEIFLEARYVLFNVHLKPLDARNVAILCTATVCGYFSEKHDWFSCFCQS